MHLIERLPRPAVEALKVYIDHIPIEHTITISVGDVNAKFLLTEKAEVEHFHWNLKTERPMLEDFVASLRPSDVVYDIGSNVGLYGCVSGPVVSEVKAIEPRAKNAARCARNLSRNHVDFGVAHRAFGSDEGTGKLVGDDRGDVVGAGQGSVELLEHDDPTVELDTSPGISVTTGDAFVAEDGSAPSVVKIDTEGAEMDVINGFTKTLRESVRRCLL